MRTREDQSARQIALGGLLLAALGAVAIVIYAQEPWQASPQARMTGNFVAAPTLGDALQAYRPVRPPLYPIILRGMTGIGVPIGAVNPIFFLCLLVWAWCFIRRVAPEANPAFAMSLFTLAHFHYPILATLTSETLFTLLVALALSALAAHLREPSLRRWLVLSLLTAAACATRYIGLFWLLPFAGWHLLARAGAPLRARVGEASGLALAVLAPLAPWMLFAYRKTGFVSGRDRFDLRENIHRSDLEGIAHVMLTVSQYVETLLVDFFSTRTWATHAVIDAPYQPEAWETGLVVLALASVGGGIAFSLRRAEGATAWRSSPSEPVLLAQAVAVFAASTLFVWSIGNNDRLYGRFLYPSYPLILLCGFCLYWNVKRRGAGPALRGAFVLLFALLIGFHLFRDTWFLRGG